MVVGTVRHLARHKGKDAAGAPAAQDVSSQRPSASQKPKGPTAYEERLDQILAKIKQSGYTALTDDEKDFLFNASRKR